MNKKSSNIFPSVVALPLPIKSQKDKKQYKSIKLQNGLTALLISDTSYDLLSPHQEKNVLGKHKQRQQFQIENRQNQGIITRTIQKAKSVDESSLNGRSLKKIHRNSIQRLSSLREEVTLSLDRPRILPGKKFKRTVSVDDCIIEEKLQKEALREGFQKTLGLIKEHLPNEDEKIVTSGLKQSAAALCIGVGSFSDPLELPGLAHFLEHMVFMGSKKYPDENGFDEYIKNHGGYNNAWTSDDMTNFYFNVQRKYFFEAFDRFIQFFIEPLIKKDAMQRERKAVDSEFEMRKTSDDLKVDQILRSLANEGHPFRKFGCGNINTLNPTELDDNQVHEQLKTFFQRHYNATSMTLVVQSQHSLEDLEKLVVSSCSAIKNNNQEKETFLHLGHPFSDMSRFSKLYKVFPTEDSYGVDLNWALPPLCGEYKTKPLFYLARIISHKGKGSLYSFLQKKMWSLGLSAFSYSLSTHATFTISIFLTKQGIADIKCVLETVFCYLEMLRQQGPNQRLFEEMKKIYELEFEYEEEEESVDIVENLATIMQKYPPKQFLSWWLFHEFDFELINKMMKRINPEDVNVFVVSKDFKNTATKLEPIYETYYIDEDIPFDWRKSWKTCIAKPEFYLPCRNVFIAENMSLSPFIVDSDIRNATYPLKIVNELDSELYFRQDTKFRQPRAFATFCLSSGKRWGSPENIICLHVLEEMMDQLMIEDMYPAIRALLGYSVSLCPHPSDSITISLNGFNDKIPELLKTVLYNISEVQDKLHEDMFDSILHQKKKDYFNSVIDPSSLADDLQTAVFYKSYLTDVELHNVVETIDFNSFRSFAKEFFHSFSIVKALVQGNISREEACVLYEMVKDSLIAKRESNSHGKDFLEMNYNRIPKGLNFLRVKSMNPKDTNTIVTNIYQSENNCTLRNIIPLDVALELMQEPVFDILRTKEQLGYYVDASFFMSGGILGVCITVNSQATKFTPEHINDRIETFVEWFIEEKLKFLSDDEFNQKIEAMIQQEKTADTNLGEEFARNWNRISANDYMFDQWEERVKLLENCKKEDLLRCVSAILGKKSVRRRISIQVVGYSDDSSKHKHVDNTKESLTEEHVLLKEGGDIKLEYLIPKNPRMTPQFILDINTFKKSLESCPIIHLTK